MKKTMTQTLRAGALLTMGAVAIAASTPPRAAAAEASHRSFNLLGESVGLVGYDPVSFFLEGGGKPAEGLISISIEHQGVTYRFAERGAQGGVPEEPRQYLPAFGGWCTWAVAELGKRVDVDPESYVVKNGRLLVFYRDPALDTRAKFLESPEADAEEGRGQLAGPREVGAPRARSDRHPTAVHPGDRRGQGARRRGRLEHPRPRARVAAPTPRTPSGATATSSSPAATAIRPS